jgi:hypothetical protein
MRVRPASGQPSTGTKKTGDGTSLSGTRGLSAVPERSGTGLRCRCRIPMSGYTINRLVSISAKFGTFTFVGLNGRLVEAIKKYARSSFASAYFSLNKCSILDP